MMLPSGPRNNCVFHMVPRVPGFFSQMPITTVAPALRAASHKAATSGPGISTALRNSAFAIAIAFGLVAMWWWYQ